jgi:hypothetical protein
LKTEHEEQREFVQWMRQTHPQHRIYAIPNGGHRGASQGAKLKAEGVVAGVPDLHIPALRTWIEMKRADGGTVSREQRDWHAYLTGIGDLVIVAKGKEEAMRAVEIRLQEATTHKRGTSA